MSGTSINRRYSKEDFAQRGDAIYQNNVRPQLTADDEGRFAAIDIDSGMFEIDADEMKACDRLRARAPQAQIWLVKVGSPYVHRFGGQERREKA
jgi:hypothetical protein